MLCFAHVAIYSDTSTTRIYLYQRDPPARYYRAGGMRDIYNARVLTREICITLIYFYEGPHKGNLDEGPKKGSAERGAGGRILLPRNMCDVASMFALSTCAAFLARPAPTSPRRIGSPWIETPWRGQTCVARQVANCDHQPSCQLD